MQFRWFKMGIKGKVAVANLSLVGLVLVTLLIAFPPYGSTKGVRGEMRPLASVLNGTLMVLTFPVGWCMCLFILFDNLLPGLRFGGVIPVLLNAYFWGAVVAAVMRRRKSRRNPTCSADDPTVRS